MESKIYSVETPSHKSHGKHRKKELAIEQAKSIATGNYPVVVIMEVSSGTHKSKTVVWPDDYPSYGQTWT